MATMNVSLPEAMKSYVEERASSGEYAGASDYVRDLIRRDQRRAAALDELRRLVDEAEAGGVAEGTPSEIIERVIERGRERDRRAG